MDPRTRTLKGVVLSLCLSACPVNSERDRALALVAQLPDIEAVDREMIDAGTMVEAREVLHRSCTQHQEALQAFKRVATPEDLPQLRDLGALTRDACDARLDRRLDESMRQFQKR